MNIQIPEPWLSKSIANWLVERQEKRLKEKYPNKEFKVEFESVDSGEIVIAYEEKSDDFYRGSSYGPDGYEHIKVSTALKEFINSGE
jgi:hypothetical protein